MGAITQFEHFLLRTTPGPGKDAKDDNVPGEAHLKLRSIPNVSTARLLRRLEVLTAAYTGEGPVTFDESRRRLVEQSMHAEAIRHELALRGVNNA